MKNKESILENLSAVFGNVEVFIQGLDNASLHLKEGSPWSIAEELGHLLFSTNGAAILYNMPKEKLRTTEAKGRTYREIADEYEEKLARNPITNNPAVLAAKQNQEASPESLFVQWQQAFKFCLNAIQNWQEEDLDRYTVWKHPLLGVVTAREMAFFTHYHTERHLESLRKKQDKQN